MEKKIHHHKQQQQQQQQQQTIFKGCFQIEELNNSFIHVNRCFGENK